LNGAEVLAALAVENALVAYLTVQEIAYQV
jgi:hypothetical protein